MKNWGYTIFGAKITIDEYNDLIDTMLRNNIEQITREQLHEFICSRGFKINDKWVR